MEPQDGVHMVPKGFVTNMEDFMAASDCIVTKAGPGTIAEAMCRGLPTMLSCFLPGQEAGNVPFVTEGGFGDYSPKPAVIAEKVSTWIHDAEKLEQMSEAARDSGTSHLPLATFPSLCAFSHSRWMSSPGRPSATYDIAKDIAQYLFTEDKPTSH
jgi:1,2-diacylglycerol 3-beta-galactosyltransferase